MNAQELSARLLDLAVRVMRVVEVLPRTRPGRHVADQLLRAGTSPGANYEEACGAESPRDFVHKLGLSLKELKESRYWLRIVVRVPLVEPRSLGPLLSELEELIAILARSIDTARRSRRK